MTTTVRLLSTYQGNSYNDIVRLPDAIATALIAGNNATLDLAGGKNVAPPPVAHVDKGTARLIYSASGTFLGLGDSQGNLLLNSGGATTPVGATVPGAPTGLALTAAAGAVIAAFTAPASTGGDPIQWYELSLSNGTVVRGDASPIAAAAPAGAAVTATVRAVNGVGSSAASAVSNSVTPTGAAPSVAPAILTAGAITGTPTQGVPLAITAATASGTPTPTGSRVIRMDGNQVAAGDLTTTYTPVAGDVGKIPSRTDTFTNGVGTPAVSTVAGAAVVSSSATLKSFNTTDSFAQGDQVLYAGSIYTFTAAHPAGSWTGNDVTYVGQNGDWPLNTVGYSKPVGIVNSWTRGVLATGTTTAPTQSRGFKLDMEAPFTALRVELFQLEPSPMRGFALSLAPTETDSLATLSQAIDPIVNGTAHSVIKGADPYGFARVTFDSALRSPVQAPGGTTPSGRGYFTNPSSVLSDWVGVSSVPVVSGKRPMVVGRLSRTVSTGDANSNVVPSALSGSYNRYLANDPSGRLMYHPLVGTNGDHVADPTLSKATGALYDATTGGVWQNMAFIAQHSVPTRVSVYAGDSITEGYFPLGIVAARLSTPKAPVYSVNLGCSTNTSSQYLALLEGYLRGENYATDVTIPSFSANEPQLMSTAFRDALIARLQYFITMCAAMKKRLYIWTSYCQYITRYSVSAGDVAIIQYINDWVRTEAAKPGATFDLVEVANGWDNATMTLGGQDNIHPTAAGNAHFDSRYTPVFQKGR